MKLSEEDLRVALANNTNCQEGHLGGYIRASPHPAPSGLRIENGDPATWAPSLWRWAVDTLGVRSVLDVGCAEGHAMRFFGDLGCRVLGVDGSKLAKRDSVMPDYHVVHDFNDGAFDPEEAFDLIWCCEFVEHVEERYTDNFLATFDASRRYIMMTYAHPGQPGWNHVNCQPEQYWVEKLTRIGFKYDVARTEETRAIADGGHYEGKGLFFVRA